MITWFTLARTEPHAALDISWAGPAWVPGNDLSSAGPAEVVQRTVVGGLLFAAFVWGVLDPLRAPPLGARGGPGARDARARLRASPERPSDPARR